MTPQSALEVKGSFLVNPFAELLVEIAQERLTGSLRVEDKDKKAIVYFRSGRLVFAVSNARSARLFEIMLRRGKLTKGDLAKIPNFSKDMEFLAYLEEKGFIKSKDRAALFCEQVEGILVDLLSWQEGSWLFTSLARARDGLEIHVDVQTLLVNYARCLSTDRVLSRFRTLEETFTRSEIAVNGLELKPDEAFVLARTGVDETLSVADIASAAAVPERTALHLLYTLWLGGLLVRADRNTAFSQDRVAAMLGARLELKREAITPVIADPEERPIEQAPSVPLKPAEIELDLTLEEFLTRAETFDTYYDFLDIDPKADAAEIKRTYFAFAKKFHPDKYRSYDPDTQRRVQNAFTELSQAHETLKEEKSRELYDFRVRKQLANRNERERSTAVGNASFQVDQAAESFEQGFNLLMDEEIEAALPFLARAAAYAPKNPKYHAYYGKALGYNESKRHKAESEMQQAIKLEPNNPLFRILLAQFFIDYGLLKRAEGELSRLLAIFPSNREARDLLATIRK